ncbi:MAG: hypothetical protein M9935_09310 [Kiritimatiellae bacterium]|nr:hypothetical protein [Kiritimatiellia bacterium]
MSGWKKELEENISLLFERKGAADERLKELEASVRPDGAEGGATGHRSESPPKKSAWNWGSSHEEANGRARASQLSVRQQCILLEVNRNRLPPAKTTPEDPGSAVAGRTAFEGALLRGTPDESGPR